MIAVVDVDGTIVDGNTGVRFVNRLLAYGLKLGILPKSVYTHIFLPNAWLPLLYPFRSLRPVYDFLQRRSTEIFFEIEANWDEEKAKELARRSVAGSKLPRESVEFLRVLSKEFRVILLSSSPQIVVDALLERLSLPLEGYGISRRWGLVFDARGKEKFLKEFLGLERVEIVVGNPGREPFEMAKLPIVIRSPKELKRWIPLLEREGGAVLREVGRQRAMQAL